jgi:hypothetical protein
MRTDHSVANATRVLDYRKKGQSVGLSTAPGETAILITATVLGVLAGAASFAFLVEVETDYSIHNRIDWKWLACFAGGLGVTLAIGITGRKALRRLRDGWHKDIFVCPACGYDLRASHERCPECGRPLPIDSDEVVRRLREMTAPGIAVQPPADIPEDAR